VFTILHSLTVYDTTISLTKALIISEHGNVITMYSFLSPSLAFWSWHYITVTEASIKKIRKSNILYKPRLCVYKEGMEFVCMCINTGYLLVCVPIKARLWLAYLWGLCVHRPRFRQLILEIAVSFTMAMFHTYSKRTDSLRWYAYNWTYILVSALYSFSPLHRKVLLQVLVN
jgi:hypothetical protein